MNKKAWIIIGLLFMLISMEEVEKLIPLKADIPALRRRIHKHNGKAQAGVFQVSAWILPLWSCLAHGACCKHSNVASNGWISLGMDFLNVDSYCRMDCGNRYNYRSYCCNNKSSQIIRTKFLIFFFSLLFLLPLPSQNPFKISQNSNFVNDTF